MKFNIIKNQSKQIISNHIVDYIYENDINIFNLEKTHIENHINNYIKKFEFSKKDYEDIKNNVIKELLIKKYYIQTKEIKTIIEILSNKIKKYKLEYSPIDTEPCIYFHIENNQSYLINYDVIEDKWYLSLIETESENLIKEIYNNNYYNFIAFLNNFN